MNRSTQADTLKTDLSGGSFTETQNDEQVVAVWGAAESLSTALWAGDRRAGA